MSSELCVGLPCFNEEANLQKLIEEIAEVQPTARIVVVDDGSSDSTAAIADDMAKTHNVVVLRHGPNRGLAEAMRTLLTWAAESLPPDAYFVAMDADRTHRPEQIAELVAKADAGADLVVAGRYLDASTTVGVPPFRKLLSVGARFVSRLLLGDLVARDVSCGYRLYRVELIQRALAGYGDQLIVSPGFSVNLELLAKLVKIGAKVDQVPLRLRYDLKGGESKIRIVRTVLQYLKLIIHLTLTKPAPTGTLPPKDTESGR